MKKESWRETRCKECVFLVSAGNDLFQCSKIITWPLEFEPVYEKKALINTTCPGLRDLPGVEANIEKVYDIADNIRVV